MKDNAGNMTLWKWFDDFVLSHSALTKFRSIVNVQHALDV